MNSQTEPYPTVATRWGAGLASLPTLRQLLPGLGLAALGCAVALGVHALLPAASSLLVAIVLGALLANLVPLPARLQPGLGFSAKRLLRLGIVLLGLQLSVHDVIGLGPQMIAVVVAIVGIGITATLALGRLLRISATQTLLIACGFSICGAAAVAAADGVIEAEEQEVATAIALVVLFGTLAIPAVGVLAPLLGLSGERAGLWAGGSIHEVAQVVAAAGALGGGALGAAVIVKLARVLMLAPVMAVLSWQVRRTCDAAGRRPPLMPLFVVGFLAAVALASTGWLPGPVLAGAQRAENTLLTAAMFALGCGVRVRSLMQVGPRPLVLGLASSLIVGSCALVGVLLAG